MFTKFSQVRPDLPELALSFGLEALISEKIEENGGEVSAEAVALAALRLYPEKVVQQHFEDLSARFVARVERLTKAATSIEAKDKPEQESEPKRTLGANLQEWTQTLDPTGICLYLSDFDPERAHRLYWRVEADLLEVALKAKLSFESFKHINHFEAAMYGFGGKYKDDSGEAAPEVKLHDLTSGQGLNELRAMGMGINF